MKLAHIKEFSRHAHTYDAHTRVQKEVASHLLSQITSAPKRILDLGCGSGEIYKNITWEIECFDGVDSSEQMLALHPTCKKVRLLQEDFESAELAQKLHAHYDLIVSSSALQWAKDIEALIRLYALTCNEGAFAIFTDQTFHDIYVHSGLKPFLPNAKKLIHVFENYFTCKLEIKRFRLEFEDTLSLFRYIKRSGVSGGQKRLSVSEMKALLLHYPKSYLEFEVLFVWATGK